MTDLVAAQAELEARMASLGIDKYRAQATDARQEGAATESRAVSYVLDAALIPLTGAIEAFRTQAMGGRAGRKHSAVRAIEGMETNVVAFLTTKLTLDGIAKGQDLTPLAIRIGGAVELEQRAAAYRAKSKEQDNHVSKVVNSLNKRTRNLKHRAAVLTHSFTTGGEEWAPWNTREKLAIGTKLVELLVSSTGLMEFDVRVTGKGRAATVLSPTRRFGDWLATLDRQAEVLSPEFLPCIIPPKDWDGLVGGGYHTDAFAYPLEFVKTHSRRHKAVLAKADLTQVYEAVNAVQRTPWAVNGAVLDVATHLLDMGSGLAGLPLGDQPIPPKPDDIDTNETARTEWRRRAATVHQLNRSLFSRRVQAHKTLKVAREFVEYAAIYFPHQLDFRGRIYAVPQALNPQGTDLAKGLLYFAEGDPIHTNAARDWFMIHGANCFGVDKVSFADRKAWVQEHQDRIVSVAKDPLGDFWWTEADSPFCFLAWAMEFAEFRRDWTNFRSRIPIAMDGSCNGLQHYSAMLQDPVAGKAVNLVPSDTPQDIYGEVAARVRDTLYRIAMQEHATGQEYLSAEDREALMKEVRLANLWGAYGITRKITKRPVMVLPYGGTLNSCQKYVHEAVLDHPPEGIPSDELSAATNWLAGIVWASIGEVVVSARLAMGWLREAAGIISKADQPIIWTTPSGFPVVQAYEEVHSTQLDTVLLGKRYQPRIDEKVADSIDRRRQVNGVAPNFVHSLDAAALVLTVNAATAQGVTKFAMIHDSYGTTAMCAPALASVLRDEFARMYEDHDMLHRFRDEVMPDGLRDAISHPPTVGGLDLNGVRLSPYFFA